MKILVIDNYDSFVYNIVQILGQNSVEPIVRRNDMITMRGIKKIRPDAIIISPGPGNPQDPKYFGVCNNIIKDLGPTLPVLGICLGHQGIASAFGGKVINARSVTHGRTSVIRHNNISRLFENVKNPFIATRYHSLVADASRLPDCLEVTAIAEDDNEIMALRHKRYLIEGLQFHPESVLTSEGSKILLNFLSMIKR
ncbi:MAG: aminodeoxychorismate/anthranilate synthase component II [Nitrososphaeraceae archaeon]|jgi:anthranilate synthase component 2